MLYFDETLEVRPDLDKAHFETVEAWAQPGDWWTAAERLAMVKEVRRARGADELPPWVRPTTVEGLIEADHLLPAGAIDAVWRLTNHPATFSEEVYGQLVSDGMTPEQYVELVSIVATANSMEVFTSALGLKQVALPGPSEGRPRARLANDAAVSTHWVPTVPGRGANVGKALTAVPVAVEAWHRLSDVQYVPPEALIRDLAWSRGALDRSQVELLAARTSLLNECFY
jgi:hypothetical protein